MRDHCMQVVHSIERIAITVRDQKPIRTVLEVRYYWKARQRFPTRPRLEIDNNLIGRSWDFTLRPTFYTCPRAASVCKLAAGFINESGTCFENLQSLSSDVLSERAIEILFKSCETIGTRTWDLTLKSNSCLASDSNHTIAQIVML